MPGNIIRVQHDKDNPYVIINKGFLEDKSISLKAKGIMAYLLSKPDNWQVYISDIANHCSCGEKSIRSGINELRLKGYIKRYPVYEDNKIDHWETVVYESPDVQPQLLACFVQVGNDTQVINNKSNIKKHKRKIPRPELTRSDMDVLMQTKGFGR
jgi:hypothetical protein